MIWIFNGNSWSKKVMFVTSLLNWPFGENTPGWWASNSRGGGAWGTARWGPRFFVVLNHVFCFGQTSWSWSNMVYLLFTYVYFIVGIVVLNLMCFFHVFSMFFFCVCLAQIFDAPGSLVWEDESKRSQTLAPRQGLYRESGGQLITSARPKVASQKC